MLILEIVHRPIGNDTCVASAGSLNGLEQITWSVRVCI